LPQWEAKKASKMLGQKTCVGIQASNATHRQYEALRAFFVDDLSSTEAAARFGYSPGSFNVQLNPLTFNLP
jgi:predicted DNA-binding protein (UPF0251 family)